MTTWTHTDKTRVDQFINTEDGFQILLETGEYLLQEDATNTWTNDSKASSTWSETSKNTATWTSPTKN